MTQRPVFLDPKADIVFKKIFGQHPDLMKSFLNNILPLPQDGLIDTLTYLTPEQSPRIPGMKNTIVDVKCTDQKGRIFIVEMQMSFSPNFLKRFLYGTSKAYVQQLDSGQPYHLLCPVYGLAIVNETVHHNQDDWFHHYRLTNVKDIDQTLEGMELVMLELPKFNPITFQHRKLGALWLRFLKDIGTNTTVIPQEFQESPEVMKAVELIQEASFSKDELEAYDEFLDAVRVIETVRYDALTEGEEKGREEGREEGRVEGREEGREEGENKKALDIARKMIQAGMPIHDVVTFTGLSIERLKDEGLMTD